MRVLSSLMKKERLGTPPDQEKKRRSMPGYEKNNIEERNADLDYLDSEFAYFRPQQKTGFPKPDARRLSTISEKDTPRSLLSALTFRTGTCCSCLVHILCYHEKHANGVQKKGDIGFGSKT
jgi:hypothetical protein